MACRNSLNRRAPARPSRRGGPDIVALLRQAVDRWRQRRSWRARRAGTHLGRRILLRNQPGPAGTPPRH
ncbi:hypothetical protein GTS_45160 [Gandjariella thermophila]|uniref:Uncharacterized protein n=1 Tax=Gandjariella thermophila TaxID=1931992 RepID=A0A4D4JG79_9PSEU|nr:hypothetical protein GTS_45160 [Gandjariella thermophila]